MTTKTVCVIGAGVAGLTAVKECLENGFEPTCYEKNDDIGGIWDFKETVTEGDPSMYKSCVLNTSKTMTCFSDFPFPGDYPNFPSHVLLKKYLDTYAEHFVLKNRIQFNIKVVKVCKAKDYIATGRWDVTVKSVYTESTTTATFDFVLVCNGHFYQPFIPEFRGLDKFEGEIWHSHEYKDFKKFEGKRVLVVGLGHSAGDIACELSRHSEHVFVSARHGVYVVPRGFDNGLPFDRCFVTRFANSLPTFLTRPVAFNKLESRVSHSRYGLSPNHPFTMRNFIVNDELPSRILLGTITMKCNITSFSKNHVLFNDDSQENIDTVIFATGFDLKFPFFDKSFILVENRFPYLYKQILPPELEIPSLALIGVVGTNAPVIPMLEMQTRWAMRMFHNQISLPPSDEMKLSCDLRKRKREELFGREIRFNIWVPYIDYMDDLATDIGCKPNLWYYLLTDPRLWWKLFFGPVVTQQYRLYGPGKWEMARAVIEEGDKHVWLPMRTRSAGERETDGLYTGLIKMLIAMLFAAAVLILL